MSFEIPDDFLRKYKIVKSEFLKRLKDERLKSVLLSRGNSSIFVGNIFNEIIKYGEYKKIDISDFDDMKIIWFLGWQLYDATNNRNFLYIALKLLLVRLPYPEKYPKIMLKKLKTILTDNDLPDVEKLYGKYGIYTTIKTIYYAQKKEYETAHSSLSASDSS